MIRFPKGSKPSCKAAAQLYLKDILKTTTKEYLLGSVFGICHKQGANGPWKCVDFALMHSASGRFVLRAVDEIKETDYV